MFAKVLVANRGAIAVRIINTLNKMGIVSVAIYAEEDRDSTHVQLAGESYPLGEGPVSNTYLDTHKIIDIAKSSGAEAIHPGYGFLSENPEFVELCEENDLIFIGPSRKHIEVFGLKHTARELAEKNSIPLLPGSNVLQSLEEALVCAKGITYPVMLKSSAGGGGIGMKICKSEEELKTAYHSVKRLSENNFSNSSVFLERYIEQARHIEVQIFGDGCGKVVAFGERDCSTQRRHQKVIEETPAPNLSTEVRQQLAATAIRLCASVNYRNAGTVEFIFDSKNNDFYFLEVNTRLQVEHGVTELIFNCDLVEWMVKQAHGNLGDINALRKKYSPKGHAIQARIYAENPARDFQPSAGLLDNVEFPQSEETKLRIDTWVESGIEISPLFDPMLAKVMAWSETREQARKDLALALESCQLYGIETNKTYLQKIIADHTFINGGMFTRFLNEFTCTWRNIDVLSSGTMTSIQDFPGRVGYWDVGVPPSGPFDSYSFQLANKLVGNPTEAAALEITLQGPNLKFYCDSTIALCGAEFTAQVNENKLPLNKAVKVKAGDIVTIGRVGTVGARAYLAISGGLEAANYLGSKSTFTLGKFGGLSGRALKTGDVLHVGKLPTEPQQVTKVTTALPLLKFDSPWVIHTIYGPHGAADFFTESDIKTFFQSEWKVHYNSSRTGIRLIGPKPEWARSSGGEAGMHPSNIHDNAYAIGAIDFTGDMPVILGPDGPSLGGFVCPATVISADLWKLGQLKAGDIVRFVMVSQEEAVRAQKQQNTNLASLDAQEFTINTLESVPASAIIASTEGEDQKIPVVYRPSGDNNILIEYGPQVLDLRLRFRVHALIDWLKKKNVPGIRELTPGIRSLQVHFNSLDLSRETLLNILLQAEKELGDLNDLVVPSRIVHLPLSWNDAACKLAVEKYIRSVRKEAPWCPDNIEFIRRINGLDSIDEVKKIVFAANYVVMGLGDVYLGAPVATPIDPRHRLVTTKYNPARTWTAENSVGIGGAYLCIYGMEGPGGYQFIGRTLQMWNRHKKTAEFSQPWLLRFFDQIKFFEVSSKELEYIRRDFPKGLYPIEIESGELSLNHYEEFLRNNQTGINSFTQKREQAFKKELDHWIASGQMNFSTNIENDKQDSEHKLTDDEILLESNVAGSLWKWQVKPGDYIRQGEVVCVLESMKMEIDIPAPASGTIKQSLRAEGDQVSSGQALAILHKTDNSNNTGGKDD